jgi:hypothetical protein
MNCLGARRALGVDPRRLSVQVQSHIAHCRDCQSYRTKVLRMDEQVIAALRTPKRDGLRERPPLARSSRSRRWRVSTGVAAVVLIVVMALVYCSSI